MLDGCVNPRCVAGAQCADARCRSAFAGGHGIGVDAFSGACGGVGSARDLRAHARGRLRRHRRDVHRESGRPCRRGRGGGVGAGAHVPRPRRRPRAPVHLSRYITGAACMARRRGAAMRAAQSLHRDVAVAAGLQQRLAHLATRRNDTRHVRARARTSFASVSEFCVTFPIPRTARVPRAPKSRPRHNRGHAAARCPSTHAASAASPAAGPTRTGRRRRREQR